MYKKVVIYLILITLSGCSVFKKQSNYSIGGKEKTNTEFLINSNLTNNSFYIQKAEIEIDTDDDKSSFLASLKFCKPDTFLISIRAKTGIEAARIFITTDTVLINDRINRTLYFGSGSDLRNKFGYSNKLLPLLFGDYIPGNGIKEGEKKCIEGTYIVNSFIDAYNLKYKINCTIDKVTNIEILKEFESKPLIISYFDNRQIGKTNYYSGLQLRDFGKINSISVKIKKISIPYNESIDFIPGKNYEHVRLR